MLPLFTIPFAVDDAIYAVVAEVRVERLHEVMELDCGEWTIFCQQIVNCLSKYSVNCPAGKAQADQLIFGLIQRGL